MKEGRCPKCGSKQVLENVHVGLDTQEGELILSVKRKAKIGPLRLPGLVTTTLSAWVCVTCGYTELYAKQSSELVR